MTYKTLIILDSTNTDRLWIADINGKQKMIDPDTSDKAKEIKRIVDHSVQFSPDGKKIYFITNRWVTSGAVHRVDINGSNHRFLIAGNSLQILPKGRYKGHLIVDQHRYFIAAGGSYDWYWLFDPNGKEIGPIGPDLTEDVIWILHSD